MPDPAAEPTVSVPDDVILGRDASGKAITIAGTSDAQLRAAIATSASWVPPGTGGRPPVFKRGIKNA